MRAMNRRAFLSAIAGIAIAPRLRGTPEPSVLVTDEWLDTVMPSHWPLGFKLMRQLGWTWHPATNSTLIPLRHARWLAKDHARRLSAAITALGFIGV